MLPYRVAIQPRLNGTRRETAKEYLMMNVVDGMTERLLDDAGIGPGMRVLVIGCGPGAVSFMMAQRVGEKGHVYGVDSDVQMLELARAAECERRLSNVSFVEGNFDLPMFEGNTFDAVVGRRVLMYQPDPIGAVRRLARVLRPGGRMLFHEHDTVAVENCRASLPLHDRVRNWLRDMLSTEGAELHMGFASMPCWSARG
jgi:ubiquinone/menaquinone biosynthesis C-methylase UbiE